MYIGCLNEKIGKSTVRVFCRNTKIKLTPDQKGNPLKGKTILVGWKNVLESGADLCVRLENEVFIDTVAVRIPDSVPQVSVSLWTKDKKQKLDASKGKGTIELHARENLKAFVLEIVTSCADIAVEAIDLFGALDDSPALFPVPEKMTSAGENFPLSDYKTVGFDCSEAEKAVRVLSEKYEEMTEIPLQNLKNGRISFEKDEKIAENGYRLSVTAQKITISASDERGFVIGAETIVKLVKNGEISAVEIEDKPLKQFRGVHIYLPAIGDVDFARRLVKYLISPAGYNYLILEIAGGMRFDSHPEITEAVEFVKNESDAHRMPKLPHGVVAGGHPLPKKVVADFCDYVRSFGIDVIPEVQSLGHVQYITIVHPEIAEKSVDPLPKKITDERLADVPPKDFYAHSYCPSNPLSHQIIFDLTDEIIETVRPQKYVHMGHDEVYQLGLCEKCSKKTPAELFAGDVNALYAHLKEKGLKMMIWGDMLQPVAKYKCADALDLIPKDVVLLDFIWYFHFDADIEDNLLEKGFKIGIGNLYSSHFPRYESRIRKENVIGGQISAWSQTKEYNLAREGKLYDFLYTAGMLWNENYDHRARAAYEKILRGEMPYLREKLSGVRSPVLHEHAENQIVSRPLSKLADPGKEIPIERTADSLVFEHLTFADLKREPWAQMPEIGNYVVTYEDGSVLRVPVVYGQNIASAEKLQYRPLTSKFFRHSGYASTYFADSNDYRQKDGSFITSYVFEWINPDPQKTIRSARYEKSCEVQVFIKSLKAVSTL